MLWKTSMAQGELWKQKTLFCLLTWTSFWFRKHHVLLTGQEHFSSLFHCLLSPRHQQALYYPISLVRTSLTAHSQHRTSLTALNQHRIWNWDTRLQNSCLSSPCQTVSSSFIHSTMKRHLLYATYADMCGASRGWAATHSPREHCKGGNRG